MTASLVLTNLPRDATAALAEAHVHAETLGGIPASQKIVVRFKAVGSAPPLPAKRELSRVSAGSKFEAVVSYLRRVLKVAEGEGVCLYVNNCFAPALDEVVGNLWRVSTPFLGGGGLCDEGTGKGGKYGANGWGQCFKDSNDQLNVGYSMTPAFG